MDGAAGQVSPAEARAAVMTAAFRARFASEPSVWVRAPGRVELMGSHTDYNLGRVLTLPIDRDTWIACRPRGDRIVHAYSLDLDQAVAFTVSDLARTGDWGDYLRGVADALERSWRGVSGLDLVVHSTIPIGGGLSSSAALEAAVATAWRVIGRWQAEPVELAALCQRAEREFVGVNCGLLDQYSACVDGRGGSRAAAPRRVASETSPIAPEITVVVGDTAAPRTVGASEYGRRRAECEEAARLFGAASLCDVDYAEFCERRETLPPVIAARAQFILEEHARVPLFARALAAGDRAAIRQLTSASYYGAVAEFEIGVSAMDAMIDAMLTSPGIIGARQSGAGFGGCLVAFVEAAKVETFADTVAAAYHEATGLSPHVFPVAPGAPAGPLAAQS
jgi:galactokinase